MTRDNNLFVVVEGGEGCGKTTFIHNLASHLQAVGYNVLTTREPGGTPFGETMREVIMANDSLDSMTEALAFTANRNEHVKKVIIPFLEQGKNRIVLCDRYFYSNMVYQGYIPSGKSGMRKIHQLQKIIGVEMPDMTFFLDCPVDIALHRIQKNNRETNRFDEKDEAFHQKVYEGFKKICSMKLSMISLDASGNDPEIPVQEALKIICQQYDGVPFPRNSGATGEV